ncbi:Methyltransferase type 11 domain protein, partial [mine drainage metagenome]
QIAPVYDDTREAFEAETIDRIAAELRAESVGSLLEVGVGTGRVAVPLAERGLHVTGVDASLGMMGRARTKGLERLVRGSAYRLPDRRRRRRRDPVRPRPPPPGRSARGAPGGDPGRPTGCVRPRTSPAVGGGERPGTGRRGPGGSSTGSSARRATSFRTGAGVRRPGSAPCWRGSRRTR